MAFFIAFPGWLRSSSWKPVVEDPDRRGTGQAKGSSDMDRLPVQARDGFFVVSAKLIVTPARQSQVVGVLRRELELDLAVDGKRFRAFRKLVLEPVIQIVMVRM